MIPCLLIFILMVNYYWFVQSNTFSFQTPHEPDWSLVALITNSQKQIWRVSTLMLNVNMLELSRVWSSCFLSSQCWNTEDKIKYEQSCPVFKLELSSSLVCGSHSAIIWAGRASDQLISHWSISLRSACKWSVFIRQTLWRTNRPCLEALAENRPEWLFIGSSLSSIRQFNVCEQLIYGAAEWRRAVWKWLPAAAHCFYSCSLK